MGIGKTPLSVVTSYLESFATADPDEIASHVSDDFENIHTSSLGDSCSDRNVYRQRLPKFLEDFSGIHYEIVEAIVANNRVAVAYVMRAQYHGCPIEIEGMFRFEVRENSINRRVDYFDSLSFLKQIGDA